MSEVIRVEGLGKEYILGGAEQSGQTFREMLVGAFKSPFKKLRHLAGSDQQLERFWALKDVDFSVNHGEIVGIIGRNGAGKSTLLKVLSRITEPTAGRVITRGRIASLLEVGTGFHPELTGRENIFLNGAILGMSRREINHKFDEIVAFAEVEQFLDTPVKRYSSGMYVRLAFSVAAHLEPEILLVDEVLAVGDAVFQKKCLGKMEEVAGTGRTVIFVSHNMSAMKTICHRGLLLNRGEVEFDGKIEYVIDRYFSESSSKNDAVSVVKRINKNCNSDVIRVKSFQVKKHKDLDHFVLPSEPFEVELKYQLLTSSTGLKIVIQFISATGEIAFTTTDHHYRHETASRPGVYKSICKIPGKLLNVGRYQLKLWAGISGVESVIKPTELVVIVVEGPGNQKSTDFSTYWPGALCPEIEWEVDNSDEG